MSLLSLTLIGVAVFVVLGAVGTLVMSDWLARRHRRKLHEAERRRAAEGEVW